MLKAIETREMTSEEFADAEGKTLESRFGSKPTSTSTARRNVLAKLKSRELAQNEK
jgi:hypothetical protein